MRFRNITFFKLPEGFNDESLEPMLQECKIKPVSGLELASTGFVPPFEDGPEVAATLNNDTVMLTFARQERVLPPAAAIREELQKRVAKHVEKYGIKPSKKLCAQIREDLVLELLPRALTRTKRVNVFLLRKHGVVAIDTSSRLVAERCISEIRRALGTFAASPVYASIDARQKLADWIGGHQLPDGVTAGYSAQLVELGDGGGRITFNEVESLADECDELVQGFCEVRKLRINQEPVASYVIGMDLIVRAVTVFETVTGINGEEEVDPFARVRADALLDADIVSQIYGLIEAELMHPDTSVRQVKA